MRHPEKLEFDRQYEAGVVMSHVFVTGSELALIRKALQGRPLTKQEKVTAAKIVTSFNLTVKHSSGGVKGYRVNWKKQLPSDNYILSFPVGISGKTSAKLDRA